MLCPRTRIFIAGHEGLLGSALLRELARRDHKEVIAVSRSTVDFRDKHQTLECLKASSPDVVIICAAKVGGIQANMADPAGFYLENTEIQNNLISGAFATGVKTLVFPSSSCVYPKDAPQPFRELMIGTGLPEPTNRAYAYAKLGGMALCESYSQQYGVRYYSVIMATLFGPNDNFLPESSHVLPALLLKFHQAVRQGHKKVSVWGSGMARREFLYVDDAAKGILFTLEHYKEQGPVNLGAGDDTEIRELVREIRDVTGFDGEVEFDTSKPDGIARKLLDASRLKRLGFQTEFSLSDGLRFTYQWLKAGHGKRIPRI